MTIKNVNDAVSILIQAAQLAQSKGVYNLEDARLIAESIQYIQELSNNEEEKQKTIPLNEKENV